MIEQFPNIQIQTLEERLRDALELMGMLDAEQVRMRERRLNIIGQQKVLRKEIRFVNQRLYGKRKANINP